MTDPHYIPETARLFLTKHRPHHALAAVIALAIMRAVIGLAPLIALALSV